MTKEGTPSANRFQFRFWDTENKQMLAPQEDIAVTGNGKIIFDNGESAPYERYERVENWLPLQSTGLLDRNGKEIFEGDVVRVVPTEDRGRLEGDLGKVVWVAVQMCFAFEDRGGGWIGGVFFGHDTYDKEVIGNIYENPDFLPS